MQHTAKGLLEKIEAFQETIAWQGDEKVQSFCLYEAEIQFNKNRGTGFGNIVIMAGGAGSGKGFVLKNLIGMQGKVMDVDAIKVMSLSVPKILAQIKELYPNAGDKDFLKDPKNVSNLHEFINNKKLFPDKIQAALFDSIVTAHPDRKPNLIFDVTLKDGVKLINLLEAFERLGYDPKKTHIVWVLNDLQVAIDQNKTRDRMVPEEILFHTHKGAAQTMKTVIHELESFGKGIDGDIYIAFNKVGVDSIMKKSDNTSDNPVLKSKADSKGHFIEKAGYVQVKESGKPVDLKKLTAEVVNKIKEYVPKGTW